jgi:hypothetical protein
MSTNYSSAWWLFTAERVSNAWGQTKQSWNPVNLLPTKWPAVNDPRPPKPLSNDMTAWLAHRISSDSQSQFVSGLRSAMRGPFGEIATTDAWISLVKTGAIWDFKKDIREAGVSDSNDNIRLGRHTLNFQVVANVYYGYMGRQIGFSETFLQAGAGVAQCEHGLAHCAGNLWDAPSYYGDQAFDGWSVGFGFYLYNNYGNSPQSLNATTLTIALDSYVTGNPVPRGP